MKIKWWILYFFIALVQQISATDDHGFVSPVEHTMRISGSFAEFRSNHFHAGIDIKSSKGRVGDRLRSIGDGYISRIKIQSGGYGNVLFITHPNGYTSVYAHMDKFLPEVAAYVKKIQYEVESFEIETYLPKDKFVLDKGQYIGDMGTTGRSTGPHLHFEIRETKTDRPVNPYLFGIAPKDDFHPELLNIGVYNLEDPTDPKRITVLPLKEGQNHVFSLSKDIEVSSNEVGLSIQMFDRMNGASNKNEVFSCTMIIDDSLEYKWKSDIFDFNDTKYVNARLDFERKKAANQNLQLLFKQDCNQLAMLDENEWWGNILLKENDVRKVKLITKDVAGNESVSKFNLKYIKPKQNKQVVKKNKLLCTVDTVLYFQNITVEIPKGTFYTDTKLNVKRGTGQLKGTEHIKYEIGDKFIPAHKFYKVTIKLPNGYGSNTCMVKVSKKGKLNNFGGNIKDGFLTTYLDEFGTFYLFKDVSLPKIETIRYSKDPKKYSEWRFKITDELEPDGFLDDLSYEARINDQWVRLLYDKKNDLIRFTDMDKLKLSKGQFEIRVGDNQGNFTNRSYYFENE